MAPWLSDSSQRRTRSAGSSNTWRTFNRRGNRPLAYAAPSSAQVGSTWVERAWAAGNTAGDDGVTAKADPSRARPWCCGHAASGGLCCHDSSEPWCCNADVLPTMLLDAGQPVDGTPGQVATHGGGFAVEASAAATAAAVAAVQECNFRDALANFRRVTGEARVAPAFRETTGVATAEACGRLCVQLTDAHCVGFGFATGLRKCLLYDTWGQGYASKTWRSYFRAPCTSANTPPITAVAAKAYREKGYPAWALYFAGASPTELIAGGYAASELAGVPGAAKAIQDLPGGLRALRNGSLLQQRLTW